MGLLGVVAALSLRIFRGVRIPYDPLLKLVGLMYP